ncbi:metal-dependent hydrolase [Salibacterium aidingense]|uniref:metal-dependent hydrolase n=1 Tax=Salibacterium aidingense TaxID=384933 RepID=UPI00041DC892|nr:metal-dependent hydrolase [Salibacterium aidingense]
MTATTHQLTGVLFGICTMTLFNLFTLTADALNHVLLFYGLIVFGSLLPDLDTPRSKLGGRFPFFFISFPLNWLFGHRTWSHSLMFVCLTFITGWMVGAFLDWEWYLCSALAIGVLSHVVGDYFFDGGVPLFYPFQKRKYRFIVTARTKRPHEWNISENIVAILLIAANSLLLLSQI